MLANVNKGKQNPHCWLTFVPPPPCPPANGGDDLVGATTGGLPLQTYYNFNRIAIAYNFEMSILEK
jgi:hypothetical protein